jgi:hypothetical protein
MFQCNPARGIEVTLDLSFFMVQKCKLPTSRRLAQMLSLIVAKKSIRSVYACNIKELFRGGLHDQISETQTQYNDRNVDNTIL